MKFDQFQNKLSIDDGLICEIDEAEQSFSLRKWFTVSLLLLVTIICGYFALPTTKTVAVSKSVEQVRDGYVTKNIEDIKVGDEVFAYDVTTGKVSKCKVTDTFERTSDHLRYLTVSDSKGAQTFETTDSHPFWVVTDKPDLSRAARDVVEDNGVILRHENIAVTEKGYYVEAKDLKVGDTFIGASGELSTLTTTSRKDFLNGIKVYNFTVADNHNYFVIANYEAYQNGANVVLVHNAKVQNYSSKYKEDFKGKNEISRHGAIFSTEMEARAYVWQYLGKKPVKLPDSKYRSRDGVWQFRAKLEDVLGEHGKSPYTHIHLEKLDPKTGEVLINNHIYFLKARGQ
jgi:hypothetical protein